MSLTPEQRTIATHAAKAFGGPAKSWVFRHSEDASLVLSIISSPDRPRPGVTSYSTVGLSDTPLFRNGKEFNTRIELAGACDSARDRFPNILAQASFTLIMARQLFFIGNVLPNAVRDYYPELALPHLYFTTPSLWGDGPKKLDLGTRKVMWLQVYPISQSEADFGKTATIQELEDRFNHSQADVCDLERAPVA